MKIINLEKVFNDMEDNFKERLNLIDDNRKVFKIISIGDDKASKVYIRKKKEFFESFGVKVDIINFDGSNDDNLMDIIGVMLNLNCNNIPYILQLPLPKAYKKHEELLISMIENNCDADGFRTSCYEMNGCKIPYSATAKGVIQILKSVTDIEGKNVLIIGRSHLVGQPLSVKLMVRGATVTVAHTKTKDIDTLIKNSDIVISCAGSPSIVNKNNTKDGQILIGVGFHYIDGKQYQDFYLEDLNDIDCMVTDRINATGKATVYSLFDNFLLLLEKQ